MPLTSAQVFDEIPLQIFACAFAWILWWPLISRLMWNFLRVFAYVVQGGGGVGVMESGVKRHFFPLTSLQIG